jgi:tRNA pseudouridine55 synthase
MDHNTTSVSGILLVDKPKGITSHDVIHDIRRRLAKGVKVGHTGTLDPMATGLLIVALGSATRLIQYAPGSPKTYRAVITLGASSTTDDAEGSLTPWDVSQAPTKEEMEKVVASFIGTLKQIPPAYSALKYQGKKLYEYARRGQAEDIAAKVGERRAEITVYSISILRYDFPELEIEVQCSSGTYIRSLARDIGHQLRTGGYLSYLRRTAIANVSVEQAISVEKLSTAPALTDFLLPAKALVAQLPVILLDEASVAQCKQGKQITVQNVPLHITHQVSTLQPYVSIYNDKQRLIGIATFDPATGLLSPKTILS